MIKPRSLSEFVAQWFRNRNQFRLKSRKPQRGRVLRRQKVTRLRRRSAQTQASESLEARILLAAPVINTNGGNNITINTIWEDAWRHPANNTDYDYETNTYGPNGTLAYTDGNPYYFGVVLEDPTSPGTFRKYPVAMQILTSSDADGDRITWDLTSNPNPDGDNVNAFAITAARTRGTNAFTQRQVAVVTGYNANGVPNSFMVYTLRDEPGNGAQDAAVFAYDHSDYGYDGSDGFGGVPYWTTIPDISLLFNSSVFDDYDDYSSNTDVDGDIFTGTDADNGGDFNFELQSSLTFTARAASGTNLAETDTISVTINLRDVNDAPFIPVDFDSPANGGDGVNVFYVSEEIGQGEFVGNLVVIDEDGDPIQLYEIVSSPQIYNGTAWVDVFEINQHSGEISINREIHPNLALTEALLAYYFDYERPGIQADEYAALGIDIFSAPVPDWGNGGEDYIFQNFYRYIEDNVQDDWFLPLVVRATDFRNLSDPIWDGRRNLRSRDTTIYIGIRDVSEYPPVVPENQLTLSVNENTPSNNITNRLIGTITPDVHVTESGNVVVGDPSDPTQYGDRDQYYTFALDPATNPNNAFKIVAVVDPVTGLAKSAEIRVNNPSAINYEQIRTFALGLIITDVAHGGGLSTRVTVTINVNDLNEATTFNNTTLNIEENSVPGSFVGTVTASDIDVLTANMHFEILSGNEATVLITGPNRAIYQALLDSVQQTPEVTLNIGDTIRFQGIFVLSDPDPNDMNIDVRVATNMTGIVINGHSLASLVSNPLDLDFTQLNPTDFLDYETTPTYNLVVRVTDTGNPNPTYSTAQATITINLINVAESEPSIQDQTFTVQENRANGTIVGTVVGTPGDADIDSTIQYSIIAGNSLGVFAINPTTGVLTIANNAHLNFETNPVFELTVQVQDPEFPDLFATATITVNLTDVNERPTITAGQAFGIYEVAAINQPVGTVLATEVDAGQTLTYSIVSGHRVGGVDVFSINAATGAITLLRPDLIDHETKSQFQLIIQVKDSGIPQLSHSETVLINILNVNEPPTVNPVGPFSVPENSAVDTVVGTVTASDVDPGDTHTWVIISGNDGNAFKIDPSTGVISVNSTEALDFEAQPSFTLVVQATDSGGETALGTVTINLTDVNEPPVVILENRVTEVQDIISLVNSRKVADINVIDDALGVNQLTLTGADAALFVIVGNELHIKAGVVLDAIGNSQLDVTVNVNDPTVGTNPDSSASMSITVLESELDTEINNNAATAIHLGTATIDTTRYGQLHRDTDRVDVYRFTIAAGDTADINILLSELSADVNLRVYTVTGNTITGLVGQSNLSGLNSEHVFANTLPAGDYLIEVVMNAAVASGTQTYYQLDVDVVATTLPIDRDDNSPATATHLGIASQGNPIDSSMASYLNRTTDRVDVYKFEIAAAHVADVNIVLDNFAFDTNLRLYKLEGNTIVSLVAQSLNAGTLAELLNVENLEAGTYAIEVVMSSAVAGGSNTSYTLDVDVVATSTADQEPNNSISTAVDLGTASVGTPINHFSGGSLNRTTDQYDLYRFAVAGGHIATAQVNLAGLSANAELQIWSLDDDDSPIALLGSSFNAGNLAEHLSLLDLEAGNYLIVIGLNDAVPANTGTTYTLSVQVNTVQVEDVEPNNTVEEAINLGAAPIQTSVYGHLGPGNSDRLDYYKFIVPEGFDYGGTLRLTGLTANAGLRIWTLVDGEQGELVLESLTAGTADELLSLPDLAVGEYLVEVMLESEAVAGSHSTYYELQVDIQITTPFEPDNSFQTATDLGRVTPNSPLVRTINSTIGGNDTVDHYKFTLGAPHSGNMSVLLSGLSQNVDVYIYNSNFSLIAYGTNSGTNNESISITGLEPGEYYIRLTSSAGVQTNYSLNVNVSSTLVPVNTEPDNSPATATNLGVFSTESYVDITRASFLHRTNDRLDTYRFAVANGQMADVQIMLSGLSYDVTLRLYKLNGNTIESLVGQSTNPGTSAEWIYAYDLTAGEYLIEVVMPTTLPSTASTSYRLDIYGYAFV